MTRTFEQLDTNEQTEAIESALSDLLTEVCEGAIRFNDKLNQDRLQQRIDKALKKADDMQTPWFAAEYLRDDSYVWEHLEGIARASAEDAEYRLQSEPYVVTLH